MSEEKKCCEKDDLFDKVTTCIIILGVAVFVCSLAVIAAITAWRLVL